MSKQFYAENRETGERWKPKQGVKQYLVMYDSGFLAEVTEDFYTYVKPLNPQYWRTVIRRPLTTRVKADGERSETVAP